MTTTYFSKTENASRPALHAHEMPEPLRLCMITDDFLPAATGVGVHVQCLARGLASRGHHVAVVTTRRPGEPACETWHGVTIYRLFSVSMYGFWQALPPRSTLRDILAIETPDIVHHHYISYLMHLTHHEVKHMGARQLYTWHMAADHLTQAWPMRPFRAAIARAVVSLCNRSDFVIAPSRNLKQRIVSDGVRVPIAYISNPVAFEQEELPMSAVRTSGPFSVLYVGRLNKEKNLPYLLRAFSLMRRKNEKAILKIVGVGDQKRELERLCVALEISESVNFMGYLSRRLVAQQYADADVFVLPSLVEAQPIVALEAMYFGKPLIVTDRIVSAREFVEPGINGFIVNPDLDYDLAEKLLRLHADPALRKSMGFAGRERSKAYSPDTFLERTAAIYRAVLVDGIKVKNCLE